MQERIPHNVAVTLDMIEANRNVWLALVPDTGPIAASPGLTQLREATLERMLGNNADVNQDTPGHGCY